TAQPPIASKVEREAVGVSPVVAVPPPATRRTQVAAVASNRHAAEGNTEPAVDKFAQFICPKTKTGIPLWGKILRDDMQDQVHFELLEPNPMSRNYKVVGQFHVTTQKWVVARSVSTTPPTLRKPKAGAQTEKQPDKM